MERSPRAYAPNDDFDLESLWALIEHGTEGGWLWRVDADEVLWSPKLCATLGWGEYPRSIETVFDLTHPDDRARMKDRLAKTFSSDGHYRIDIRLRKADDQYLPVSARGVVLPPTETTERRMLGFILDQTDPIRYRQSLARSEARFRAFMDNCPAGVFIKDRDGQHLYANPAAADIAGVPTLEGTWAREVFPPDIAESLRRSDEAALSSDRPLYSNEVIRSQQGVRHVLDVKFAVPDLESDSKLLGGFAVDISDRVRMNEELRALDQRLQDKQRLESLGLLAGGVAHDFNNILLTILGHAELADASEPELRAQNLAVVRERCQHAANLCNQLLLYAGRSRTVLQATDMATLIRESGELLDVSRSRGLKLDFAVPHDLPPVNADPTQLRQVLLNLVMNSAQAVEGLTGATVSVQCDLTDVEEPRAVLHRWTIAPPPYVRIQVSDNGAGMTPEQARLAFEPFFSTKPEGHGLGLSTVLGIVRGHGGAIAVDTGVDRGTKVEVYLPTTSSAPQAPPEPAPTSVSLIGRVALVVDDQPQVLRTTIRLLHQLGIRAVGAGSGDDALRRIDREGPFDVAIVDVTMPGMNGVELAEHIRSRRPALPIILMSGYTHSAQTDHSAVAFIHKPFSMRALARCIAEVLQS